MSRSKGLLRTLRELYNEFRSFGNAEVQQLTHQLVQQKQQLEQLKAAEAEYQRYQEMLALAELRRAVEEMKRMDAKLAAREKEVVAVADELGRSTELAQEAMMQQRAADILSSIDYGKLLSDEAHLEAALKHAAQQLEQHGEQQQAASRDEERT